VLPVLPEKDDAFAGVIDRRGGDSLKWNRYAGRDVLPLWVADMDFAAPPAIVRALEKRVAHGCFGYAEATPALLAAVLGHLQRAYGWQVEADWLVWLPGLVSGLNVACRAIDGDVLTATPIYPPFLSAPGLSGKALATAPLQQLAGRWLWDFAALQRALTPNSRLLLLCHPHNPVGRAWDDDELAQIAAFCNEHQLIVCSDEIHCQLLLDQQRRHRPLATIDADLAQRSITLMAPSKTYNIPGLACAFAVIPNTALRRRFTATMRGIVPHVNALGLAAMEAAYRDCDDWQQALLAVLRNNRDRVTAVARRHPWSARKPRRSHLPGMDRRTRPGRRRCDGFLRRGWRRPLQWRGLWSPRLATTQFWLPARDAGCGPRTYAERLFEIAQGGDDFLNLRGDARDKESVARPADRIQQRA
jgi:cystathionine beta-lyase